MTDTDTPTQIAQRSRVEVTAELKFPYLTPRQTSCQTHQHHIKANIPIIKDTHDPVEKFPGEDKEDVRKYLN